MELRFELRERRLWPLHWPASPVMGQISRISSVGFLVGDLKSFMKN